MILNSKNRFMANGMPAEMIQQIIKRQKHEIIDAMISRMEPEKIYKVKVKLHQEIIKGHDMSESVCRIEVEPLPEFRIVYKSPEELHLKPTKSLITRLINCWEYLRDDSQGIYVLGKRNEE